MNNNQFDAFDLVNNWLHMTRPETVIATEDLERLVAVVKGRQTLNEIGAESLKTSVEKGFQTVEPSDWHIHGDPDVWQQLLVPTKLALIHSEVSEALEEFRKGHDLEKFGGELADIIIRVGQLGVGLGIDLDTAVRKKLEANRSRPHQHGGRLI